MHEISGYVTLGLVAFRILWGFAGPRYARFASFVPTPGVLVGYLRDLARGRAARALAHNPAGAAMTLLLLLLLAISTVSGWMQLTYDFFGVTWVELVHSYASHLVMILAVVHVLGVLFMGALHKENLVWSMITGQKRGSSEHREKGS